MIEKIYRIFLASTGVCTDTRSITEGNLFVALKGPNFNANSFAAKALEMGASHAIIDDESYVVPGKTTLVEDGLATLQELAVFHRRQLKIPVIGITGSNGKTTTKELMHTVLQAQYNTFATKGNLNNHIGVPLSVLDIRENHEMAIIEMGANHVGEIAQLSAICRPTHGLITNIGKAHIGLFGGIEGIIRGKSELYDFLIKQEGTIFVNQNQEKLMNMKKRMNAPILYPNRDGYYHCKLIDADPYVKIETKDGNVVNTNLVGAYNFDNIATALCIGKYFKVPNTNANNAVANYIPENNRSQILKKGSNSIILDAYNANPSSMEKALENLSNMKGSRRIAIIGDMFELGDDTVKEHAYIGAKLKELNIQDAFFCGSAMQAAYDAYSEGHYMMTKDLLISYLKENKFADSTILIKASRGIALEDVVKYI